LGVGVEVAFHYDVKPGSELVLAARPDLDQISRSRPGPWVRRLSLFLVAAGFFASFPVAATDPSS
jgi:hypothetical protein